MKLKEYLDKYGIKSVFLANKAKISECSLSRILKCKYDLSLSSALRICEATGGKVTVYDLIPPEVLQKVIKHKERKKHKKAEDNTDQQPKLSIDVK